MRAIFIMAMPPKKSRSALIVHTDPLSYADAVRDLGWEPVPCPVLDITLYDTPIPMADIAIVSSVHALHAAQQACLPVIIVGERTAEAAIAQGLNLVVPPLECIADLMSYRDLWRDRSLVHLCGAHVAPDTPAVMEALQAQSLVVYGAMARMSLGIEVERHLSEGSVGAVLCFSARSAHVFTDVAKRATNNALWPHVTGVAFSDPVATAMKALPFGAIKVAAAPRRNSMLETLGHEQFS